MKRPIAASTKPKSIIKPQLDRMETRLTGLEEKMEDARVTLARLDERMNNMATKTDFLEAMRKIDKVPTRWELYAVLIGIMALPQLPNIIGQIVHAIK